MYMFVHYTKRKSRTDRKTNKSVKIWPYIISMFLGWVSDENLSSERCISYLA